MVSPRRLEADELQQVGLTSAACRTGTVQPGRKFGSSWLVKHGTTSSIASDAMFEEENIRAAGLQERWGVGGGGIHPGHGSVVSSHAAFRSKEASMLVSESGDGMELS